MAIPSGGGTGVLRRGTVHSQNDTATSFKFDGTHPTTGTSSYAVPTDHIITMLSITICCTTAVTDQNVTLWLSSPEIFILRDVLITTNQTYVYNDRLVLTSGDILKINAEGSSAMDVYYSYIDQDWS